jgi:hypothetical protein
MPDRFWPTDIGTGEVLGVLTGELGVEYIVTYEILKPSPGR